MFTSKPTNYRPTILTVSLTYYLFDRNIRFNITVTDSYHCHFSPIHILTVYFFLCPNSSNRLRLPNDPNPKAFSWNTCTYFLFTIWTTFPAHHYCFINFVKKNFYGEKFLTRTSTPEMEDWLLFVGYLWLKIFEGVLHIWRPLLYSQKADASCYDDRESYELSKMIL